jgi:hypothetical protein
MGVGPPLVLAGLGGRAANALLSGRTQKETIRILSEAFRDPEFAALLIKPLTEEVDAQIAETLSRFIKDDNAVLTTSIRVGTESFKESGERLIEDNPKITIEFDDGYIDETGTIQSKEKGEIPVSMNTVNPESRLSNVNMVRPITDTGAINANTMARGSQLFGGPREITFAAQGGIMNARKPMQRVA